MIRTAALSWREAKMFVCNQEIEEIFEDDRNIIIAHYEMAVHVNELYGHSGVCYMTGEAQPIMDQ